MKALHISGKRWFQKSYGNTYHSVKAFVDGKLVVNVPYCYGYDSQYIQTAENGLAKLGYLSDMEHYEPLHRYCERKGIIYTTDVANVTRKRDL